MRIIGITGGVGAGKSTVLSMLSKLCNCKVIMADDVAKSLMEYGAELSADAIRLFGENAYTDKLQLNRSYIASAIYADETLLHEWTGLVHPATKRQILSQISMAREEGMSYTFIEAALLFEDGYQFICDEIWYVYASRDVRIKRLMADRGYSLEKIDSIDANQMTEEAFRASCDFVIDTGVSIDYTREQLENKLEEYR